MPLGRRIKLLTLGAATVSVVALACSSPNDGGATTSPAFPTEARLTARIDVAPGDGWSYMIADVRNGNDAVVLQSVNLLEGEGSGNVRVGPAQVAPVPKDPVQQPNGWTPGGVFKTYPPAFHIPGASCNVQLLASVHGYALAPSHEVRFLFPMRSLGPGKTIFPGFRVIYTISGHSMTQSFPTSLVVTSRSGKPLPMSHDERRCSHLSSVLPTGT
jgi:hypothetical protein